MLDALFKLARDPAAEQDLLAQVSAHEAAVVASAHKGDRSLVEQAERALQANPSLLAFDGAGHATLTAAGHTFAAGRFEPTSIAELRARSAARKASSGGSGRARLWIVCGTSPVTDIGALQAFAPEGCLFQVASQFNCLESPGPFVVPVVHYLTDPTQGPRASISAFPGTLLRHYAAPGAHGERFVQSTHARQINLLEDVCAPDVACPENGYLMDDSVKDASAFLAALHERFEAIRVGVHDGVEVVLGFGWDGAVERPGEQRIAQVLTSTVAGGGYGGEALGPAFVPVCSALQRAAYLGTLLAAASLGKKRVVLTLIGGGVFANPVEVIWDAIVWAIDEVGPFLAGDLDVVVNGRDLDRRIARDKLATAARDRSGAMIVVNSSRPAVVHR